ncbi:MAG TPA: potassium-transporting ATPase subunit KdpA [Candidatus Eisenbacteria bacterium]|nr:potassium-transporting ATPase subunit KdpA [Candidatus Eisenbacteria bacterium]
MTGNGWFQIAVFLGLILLVTRPLGTFLYRVYERKATFLDLMLRPVEKLIYRLAGIDETQEMDWKEYGTAMLIFSGVSLALLYLIERTQQWLPWNPQRLPNVAPDLAWNSAVSFTTNTNWQSYVPEATMSYFTQMAGLAYHNFVSAAVGVALAIAVIRGIARRESKTIGNFWVDTTRGLLWVFLPLCVAGGLALVSQGVVQNLNAYTQARLIEPQQIEARAADGTKSQETITTQTIAQGPAASQVAIKMLGTNGGGFFNANSAHPFENPTPVSNFLEMLMIFAIPSALTYTLGRMTGSARHGWAVWSAMAALFLAGVFVAYAAESRGNPLLKGVDQHGSLTHPGGNMEGKEVRFGIADSVLFTTATTDASCGAVKNAHDSLTPIAGMVALINIMLGEVIFGGVGAGLYGIVVFVVLSVFIAGLMVGRTPEYLGKKIEAFDVKMAVLSILVTSLTILIFSAAAVVTRAGLAGITNPGPHGLSQILYAYSSGAGNNGSAFGGINANTLWFNSTLGVAMLLGRFFCVIPILAIAGNLGAKKHVPESLGTFPVTGPLFTVLLISVVLIVGALTFFPSLSLGPILEHLLMNAGKAF